MWRPSAAREALSLSALVQAGGADASRIKGIPRMSAFAEPAIFRKCLTNPPVQRLAFVLRFSDERRTDDLKGQETYARRG